MYRYHFNIETERPLSREELLNSYSIIRANSNTEVIEHPDALAYKRGDSVMVVSYIPELDQIFGACMTVVLYEKFLKEAQKVNAPLGVFAWAYRWGEVLDRNHITIQGLAEDFSWFCEKPKSNIMDKGLPATTDILYILSALSITDEKNRHIAKDVIRGVCDSWETLISFVADTPITGHWKDGIKQEYRNLKVKATVLNVANDITINVR